MSDNTEQSLLFSDLQLRKEVLDALSSVGYETPTPIQAATIPVLLEGVDLIGQAQTGTGKTAAFALPVLSQIDLKIKEPQVLVLAPTRELAIQVADAFNRYAGKMKGFRVLPVYGGADYSGQFRQLKRGVHVVVGTPGRVMDHIRRGSLCTDSLRCLVLDEADEMLRMGFIDDVEWVLDQIPEERQIALFSATMPDPIRRIAKRHLSEPRMITIKQKRKTADTIRQRYWMGNGRQKMEALTRILEAETFDGIMVFVRTKSATVEVAEQLCAHGFAATALNGDIPQAQREKVVQRLKKKQVDIIVATDVAARGLDVDRVSHVINYDIPFDTEAYVHRIGRTGRAGREGEAILFVAPRERKMLGTIEKATHSKIEQMELPAAEEINQKRIADFKQKISDALASEKLGLYQKIVDEYQAEFGVPERQIAAALATMLHSERSLLLEDKPNKPSKPSKSQKERRDSKPPEAGMVRYRIEVGHCHQVRPGNIVGAISNEAGLDSQYIGQIDIREDHSMIDLPDEMPHEIFRNLKRTWVAGQQLRISRADGSRRPGPGRTRPFKKKRRKAPSKM